MLKDYDEHIFLKFDENKQLRILFELAHFIELNPFDFESKHFKKLSKYHNFLKESENKYIQMANKEFAKISNSQRQFQIYITLLERLIGNSSKDYQFMMQEGDKLQEKKTGQIPVVLVLDGVRSNYNIGSIIRSAECFAIEKVYLQRPYDDFNEELFYKTSMGAEKNVKTEMFNDIEKVLKQLSDKYQIYSIDTFDNSKSYKEINIDQPIALIFGHEQLGVSKTSIEYSKELLNIPMGGIKNSLNVSNACSIILSDLFQRFKN